MDSLTFSTNWNNLPNEAKIKIIKKLDNNSRLALKSCSIDDFKLVESVPFRKIYLLHVKEDGNGYHILLKENYYSETGYQFKDFEEFQEKILKILDNAEYIEKIYIDLKNSTKNLELMKPENRKVKVEELTVVSHRVLSCLQQVDSSTLKKLYCLSELIEESEELYDMPHLNCVDELMITGFYIRDDDLMKLKPKKLRMFLSGKLTANGICNYIKKSTSDPNFEKLDFSWLNDDIYKAVVDELFTGSQQNNEGFIHPSFPEFETCIGGHRKIKMSRIRTNSTAPLEFEKVERLMIKMDQSTGQYELIIKEKSYDNVTWSHRSSEEVQNILTEKMSNIKYIKRLEVTLQRLTCCWRFVPEGSLNRITVGHLKTNCNRTNGQLAIDLLEQIEPGHLKCVELNGKNVFNDVFNMQQVIQADYVKIPHSNMQDYQLLKLSATRMSFGNYRGQITEDEKITASGVNQFIKKCFLDLKKRNYGFELVISYQCKYREFISTLLEGLDIFSQKNDQEIDEEFYPSEVIVNSNWKDFKLKLTIDGKYLQGKRIDI